jgi:hypothetical protein
MRIVLMPLKTRIATFVHDGAGDVSEITMEVDRIVFVDQRDQDGGSQAPELRRDHDVAITVTSRNGGQ